MENSIEKQTELDLPHTCGEECKARNGCDPGHQGELGPSGEIGMTDGPGAITEKQAEMTFKCGACGKDIGGKIEQMVEDIPVCQECFTKTHTPIKRMARKIGRNELCPCGSNRKFKKCCISKAGQVG